MLKSILLASYNRNKLLMLGLCRRLGLSPLFEAIFRACIVYFYNKGSGIGYHLNLLAYTVTKGDNMDKL